MATGRGSCSIQPIVREGFQTKRLLSVVWVIERRTAVNAETVVLRGLVRADGTLEVLGKVGLTPGPVEVTVRTVAATATPRGNWWEALAKIRAVQAARGHAPRTREEINALRDE